MATRLLGCFRCGERFLAGDKELHVCTAIDPGITPEQLLEIEVRHGKEFPKLGYFEPGQSNQDVQKLIEVIRRLTGWPKHDAKLFERRLGRAAAAAAPKGRKKP